MQGKVEISGVNTAKLETLSNEEMMHLIELAQAGDEQAKQKLVEKNGREPTMEEIARAMDVPLEEVVGAMDAIASPVSLYEPVYSDGGDPLTVMDQVRDTKNTDERWLDSIAIRQAISQLSAREKRILALRFYDGRTQMEVAGSIGISQAQVSRLEKNALSAIRRAISVS